VWNRLEEGFEPVAKRRSWHLPVSLSLSLAGITFIVGIWIGSAFKPSSPTQRSLDAEPTLSVEPASMQAQSPHARESEAHPSTPKQHTRQRTLRKSNALSELEDVQPEVVAHEPQAVIEGPRVDEPPLWQRFANSGEYESALVEIGQAGGFEQVLAVANAEQLMLLADVARATGQRQRALAALRRILADYRDGQTAPLAAFSLGTMLEKAGDQAGAAQAFAVYRSLSPRGDFAEDALVRELRSAVDQNERERALQLLAQYESEFPTAPLPSLGSGSPGDELRHSEEVRRLRERLLGAGTSDVDAGASVGAPTELPLPRNVESSKE
jgi:TolA-binding protein